MKKNIVGKVVVVAVILLMFLPIIIDKVSNGVLKTIDYSGFEKAVSNTAQYKYALVYVGKDDKDAKKVVKDAVDNAIKASKDGDLEVSTYFMDVEDMSSLDLLSVLGNSGATTGYVFIANGEVQRVEAKELSSELISAFVTEYSGNGISSDLVKYKTYENANAFKKLYNDKKVVTMTVFGRESCFYCNQFKPVYNTVAEDYNIDIYYVNNDAYLAKSYAENQGNEITDEELSVYYNAGAFDVDEYEKILDMGIVIPEACSGVSGQTALLKDGFGTPLTLFTKNGKVIDCISGYVNKSALIAKLKTVGMIEAE